MIPKQVNGAKGGGLASLTLANRVIGASHRGIMLNSLQRRKIHITLRFNERSDVHLPPL